MTAGQSSSRDAEGLRYDTRTAFDPIAQVGPPLVMVTARLPGQKRQGADRGAKAAPGKIVFGSPGFGAPASRRRAVQADAGVDMHARALTAPRRSDHGAARRPGRRGVRDRLACSPGAGRAACGRSPSPARTAFRPCGRAGGDRVGRAAGYDVTTWVRRVRAARVPPAVIAS